MLALRVFDQESNEQFARDYERTFYEGDYVTMAAVYTEDAKLLIEDGDIIEGRPAIEEFWKTACARANAVGMKRSIRDDELERSGDLAYKRSNVTLEIPSSDGKVAVHVIKSITVWKRELDGVWRIKQDISNRNAPLDFGELSYGVSVGDQRD
jgi:ketosteroid isomerase-like protein